VAALASLRLGDGIQADACGKAVLWWGEAPDEPPACVGMTARADARPTKLRNGSGRSVPYLRAYDDVGGGFICIVSRHNLGESPVAFLNAMRNRFSLA
jgi:hypothetical protein